MLLPDCNSNTLPHEVTHRTVSKNDGIQHSMLHTSDKIKYSHVDDRQVQVYSAHDGVPRDDRDALHDVLRGGHRGVHYYGLHDDFRDGLRQIVP